MLNHILFFFAIFMTCMAISPPPRPGHVAQDVCDYALAGVIVATLATTAMAFIWR